MWLHSVQSILTSTAVVSPFRVETLTGFTTCVMQCGHGTLGGSLSGDVFDEVIRLIRGNVRLGKWSDDE